MPLGPSQLPQGSQPQTPQQFTTLDPCQEDDVRTLLAKAVNKLTSNTGIILPGTQTPLSFSEFQVAKEDRLIDLVAKLLASL